MDKRLRDALRTSMQRSTQLMAETSRQMRASGLMNEMSKRMRETRQRLTNRKDGQ